MLADIKKKLAIDGQASFRIKVMPGAPETGWRPPLADGTLKVAIAAAPEKGKANKELLAFLADSLGVAKENIRIIAGAGTAAKVIRISL